MAIVVSAEVGFLAASCWCGLPKAQAGRSLWADAQSLKLSDDSQEELEQQMDYIQFYLLQGT